MSTGSPPTGMTAGDLIESRDGTPFVVELFVRTLAPFGTRSTLDTLIDRLEALSEAGIVDAISVRVWGDSLRPDAPDHGVGPNQDPIDRILDIFEFVADSPCSVGRYFRTATDSSLVDSEARRRLVPPRRCLSIRRDGDVVAVFPCDVGGAHLTPGDAVEYLETIRDEQRMAGAASE